MAGYWHQWLSDDEDVSCLACGLIVRADAGDPVDVGSVIPCVETHHPHHITSWHEAPEGSDLMDVPHCAYCGQTSAGRHDADPLCPGQEEHDGCCDETPPGETFWTGLSERLPCPLHCGGAEETNPRGLVFR